MLALLSEFPFTVDRRKAGGGAANVQRRQAIVPCRPLTPLPEPEQAFQDQQPDHDAIWREAEPAGFCDGIGPLGHYSKSIREFGV